MLKVKKDPISDATLAVFHLEGEIDDVADFSLVTATPAPDVTINFNKVSSINSFGIRKMVQMVTALKGKRIHYEDCRVALVGQFNMITSLVSEVDLISFYLPYECTACDVETEKRILTKDAQQPGFMERLNKMFACDRCNRSMTFMDDESIYFFFMKKLKAAA